MLTINKFPTLATVVNHLEAEAGNGLCFHRSAALCLDLHGSHIVIGIFTPDVEAVKLEGGETDGQPFFHCWVECQGCVLAPTTIERLGGLEPMHKLGYYNINRASSIRRVTRDRLIQIMNRNREIYNQLMFAIQPEKDGLLVDKLMKAARLSYQVNERNGVIPC